MKPALINKECESSDCIVSVLAEEESGLVPLVWSIGAIPPVGTQNADSRLLLSSWTNLANHYNFQQRLADMIKAQPKVDPSARAAL